MSSPKPHFCPATFAFLRELAGNNNRDWFERHKSRYEEDVLEPALAFVSDFGPRLAKISRHFQALPKRSGGSVFRIYRDVRFARDKSPYKTYTGIQFRHRAGKDAHCPGYYLHLEPGHCFAGLGIWHPDAGTLKKIRDHLVARPARWRRALGDSGLAANWKLEGDALKRPPRGYDRDHPLIEDLKRKDFIAVRRLTQKEVTARGFIDDYAALCRSGTPFVRWLCDATGQPF